MAKKEQTLAIPQQKQSFSKMIRKNKYYFLMALPAVISTFIFCYIPMYGVLIAFQDYHVGDSILGYKSHMGAGSITSNVKSDKTLVVVRCKGEECATGLKKFGAMLGDNVEVGCNSVLNPGTVIGRGSNVYPLSRVRGYVPENSIYKSAKDIVTKK